MLTRRNLIESGELSEPLIRRAAAALAETLAGGERGFSWNYGEAAGRGYDPDGWFATVTEGRQCRWKDKSGKWRSYSACEDLPGAVLLRVLGMPPAPSDVVPRLNWCNRVDAGNKWIAGWNLRRIQERLSESWRPYGAGSAWSIGVGDAVQVQGKVAHTFVITALELDDAGEPVACDHADYGAFHQPLGASRADHSCRVHRAAAIGRGRLIWTINGRPVIGRMSLWDVVRHVVPEGIGLPAWVPPGFVGGIEADSPYLPEGEP